MVAVDGEQIIDVVTMSYLIITPRPFWGIIGFAAGFPIGAVTGAALTHLLPDSLRWLSLPVFLVACLASIVFIVHLSERHDQVSWVNDVLLIQPIGWERYVRSARQIAREEIKSYLVECERVRGPQLRLRLHSGKRIFLGAGDFWGWRKNDQYALLEAATTWLETGPLPSRPQQEPTFWAGLTGTALLIFMTLLTVGFTVWGLFYGLAQGKSWWGVVPVYFSYLTVVLSWRNARKQKRTD